MHTNNVKGVHALIKKDSARQFNRSPDLKQEIGLVLYLDLAQWRVNQSLMSRNSGQPKNLFRSWLKILKEEVIENKKKNHVNLMCNIVYKLKFLSVHMSVRKIYDKLIQK